MKHLALCLLLILCACPVWAQDAAVTVESAPVVLVTEGAPDTTVVCEAGATCAVDSTPVDQTDSTPVSPLLQLVLGLVAIVVGMSYALDKIGNRAQAVTDNRLAMTAVEKAADNIPSAVVTPILAALERTTKALERITDFAQEATDKKPIIEKPETIVGVNTAPESVTIKSNTAKVITTYPPQTGTPLHTDYTTSSTGNLPAEGFDTL